MQAGAHAVTVAAPTGPLLPGDPPLWPRRALLPPVGAMSTALLLTACMPSLDTPEGRRAAYLDCARDQGLRVEDGTIRTTSAAELDRLGACEALPR